MASKFDKTFSVFTMYTTSMKEDVALTEQYSYYRKFVE